MLLEYEAHLTAATTGYLRLGNSEDHGKYMAMAEAWGRVVLSSSVQGMVTLVGFSSHSSESALHKSVLLFIVCGVFFPFDDVW